MLKIFEKAGHDFYRCIACNLEKTYPQASDSELSSIYDNEYYEAWGDEIGACEEVKKETFKIRLKLIPEDKNKKILDCGCAAGYLLEIAREQGFIPYGIDINPIGIEIARRKFPSHQVYKGTLEDSPFPGGFFYAIFMNDFLEHVRNPAAILKLAYQLLEPEGFLVIATPDTNSFSHKITRQYWPHYKPEHLFYFNRDNIGVLLKNTQFRLLSAKKAWKCLALDYLRAYFHKYPQKFITVLTKAIRLLPRKIRFKKNWFCFGEMAVVARKP